MIMHVLKFHGKDFDYMVGAQIDGFDTMVNLSNNTDVAVFEGDEYLSSPIDPRPKFHLYKPHIAVLSGIAWDHMNVFPTFENYCEQFQIFIDSIEKNGTLYYFKNDPVLCEMVKKSGHDIVKTAYDIHAYTKHNNTTCLINIDKEIPLQIFGQHNLQNISAAKLVCNQLGISDDDFYQAISSFKGAAKRLEVLAENEKTIIFRDFAHSPSKLKATVTAVKEQYSERDLFAIMELHTFSSLNANFLKEYRDTMELADIAVVYFNPDVIKHKKLDPITKQQVKEAFGDPYLIVFTNQEEMIRFIKDIDLKDKNLLFMSSGNFSGIDLPAFAHQLIDTGR